MIKPSMNKESRQQAKNERQEAAEDKLPRRSLRLRTANSLQTLSPSVSRVATRKQAQAHAQQQSSLQQTKDAKRRLDTLNSVRQSSTPAPRQWAGFSPHQTVVDRSGDHQQEEEEEQQEDEEEVNHVEEDERDPVRYWTKHHKWPKALFEPGDDNISHVLARPKFLLPRRQKQSIPISVNPASSATASVTPSWPTPSDQKSRVIKSTPYQDPRYVLLLETKGTFMKDSELNITQKSEQSYLNLLNAKQTLPRDSLFRDDAFSHICQNLLARNEARVIRDISLLIVPSAEILSAYGAKHLSILTESTNEGWNNSIPLTGTRPQPDFSVGFRRQAFSEEQLDKLAPFVGNFIAGDQSYFMATYYMYFPFLTCEVKCGAAVLETADKQNAHSMTLAVRGVVELFRLVGREMELHREILAYSVSHNNTTVRLYGHYPIIHGKQTNYHSHLIHAFGFTVLDGREKWTAYTFVKNIYDTWMPSHFQRLCSAIDQIPADLDFGVLTLSPKSELSEDIERCPLRSVDARSKRHSERSTRGTSIIPRKRLADEE